MPQMTGNSPLFSFDVEGDEYVLRVLSFRGVEKVSAPFQYSFELASEDENIALNSVLGKTAVLSLQNEDGNIERYVHGVVTHFQYFRQHGRFAIYRAEVVPRIALLDLRHNVRIFQAKTTPEIIQDVFKAAKIMSDQFTLKLNGNYEPREYCVQYRETDLSFVSRLMEEEGIFYLFEHSELEHVMILADHEAAIQHIESPDKIPFNPGGGLAADGDCVQDISYSEQVHTGRVVLHDFNFKKPTLDLQAKKENGGFRHLEAYDTPGHYAAPSVGEKFAQVRLEAAQAGAKVANAQSSCMRLVSGYRFTLSKHPREGLNQEYFITHLECEGSQPQALEELAGSSGTSFQNRVSCIPAAVPFRAPIVTYRPRVEGVQTAIVTGPAGEEIYVDEFGRVKVHFHWDRDNKGDEKSSCWIRVSQTMAGQAWGAVSIPRVGHEVIVDFVEGNPDRPIILGQVYHGTNRPPFALPGSGMVSGMKSNTTPKGGGSNEMSMNDTKGKESMTIHAQKDMSTTVEHDQSTTVKNDQSNTVNNKFTETIKSDATIKITEGKYNHDVVAGTADYHVQGALTEKYDATQTTTVKQDIKVSSTTGAISVSSDAKNVSITATTNVSITAITQIELTVGASSISMDSSGVIKIKGVALEINGMGDHVHVLVGLKPTHCLSDFMRVLKSESSEWVHKELHAHLFQWQEGYFAVSVSPSQLEKVRHYIRSQEEHHRQKSFEEEYVELLKLAGIEYDERYLW